MPDHPDLVEWHRQRHRPHRQPQPRTGNLREHLRHDRHQLPAGDEVGDRREVPRAHDDPVPQPMSLEALGNALVIGRRRRRHHQRRIGEARAGAPAIRAIAAAQRDVALAEQQRRADTTLLRIHDANGQIDLAAPERIGDPLGRHRHVGQARARGLAQNRVGDRRQEDHFPEVRQRQAPLGGAAQRIERLGLGQRGLQRLQVLRSDRHDPLGQRGGHQPAGRPNEQGVVERLAQARQRVAGGRLAQREPPPGFSDRSAAIDLEQHAQQVEVEPVELGQH